MASVPTPSPTPRKPHPSAPPAAASPWDVRSWQDPTSQMLLPQLSTQRMLVPVEVYVDFVCPWCYLEVRSLAAAMDGFVAAHPEVEFEVRWRPFYVAPLLRRGPAVLNDGAGQRALLERLRLAAAPYGLALDRHAATAVGPTRDAHKLVALAGRRGGRGAQARVVEALMRAALVDARDISRPDVLARIAGDALGLDRADVFLELADDDATRRVDREVEAARESRGIEAVPCVTVLGRFKVGGFQDAHVFTDLFAKIYDEKLA